VLVNKKQRTIKRSAFHTRLESATSKVEVVVAVEVEVEVELGNWICIGLFGF
jgi:hypothetical protein